MQRVDFMHAGNGNTINQLLTNSHPRAPGLCRDPAPTYPPASYDRAAYDSRSGYGSGYDSRYPADYAAYDRDRYAAGGPDRSRYPAPRPGPYDRPIADTRRDARPSR